jgi:TIR domain
MPVKVFFCYAREDEVLLGKLKTHLRPLERAGLIEMWYDREIRAGSEWEKEIDKHLTEAQIVLLLVSPDFLDSDYCYQNEMTKAIERHEQGEARVIPVILRSSNWKLAPIGKLQTLPKDGKPIVSSEWHNQDDALNNVSIGVESVVEEIIAKPLISPSLITQQNILSNIPHLSQNHIKSPVQEEGSFIKRRDYQKRNLPKRHPSFKKNDLLASADSDTLSGIYPLALDDDKESLSGSIYPIVQVLEPLNSSISPRATRSFFKEADSESPESNKSHPDISTNLKRNTYNSSKIKKYLIIIFVALFLTSVIWALISMNFHWLTILLLSMLLGIAAAITLSCLMLFD